MQVIEFFLNRMHFCIYYLICQFHLFFNKINPFRLIPEIPTLKKKYQELGVDVNKEVDGFFKGRRYGVAVTRAGGVLMGVLYCFWFGVFHILGKILFGDFNLSVIYFMFFGALSFATSYFFVFKEDKYLKYFKRFDKWGNTERRKSCWVTVLFVLSAPGLFFLSLVL